MQLNMLGSKDTTIINSCLRQRVNVISHKEFSDKRSYQGSISQIFFGVSIKFLIDSSKSVVQKVFQKLLKADFSAAYFALLSKPELLIKRTLEGNWTSNELTAHEAVSILSRTREKCAIETRVLLKSVAEFLSISEFHPGFLLPVF